MTCSTSLRHSHNFIGQTLFLWFQHWRHDPWHHGQYPTSRFMKTPNIFIFIIWPHHATFGTITSLPNLDSACIAGHVKCWMHLLLVVLWARYCLELQALYWMPVLHHGRQDVFKLRWQDKSMALVTSWSRSLSHHLSCQSGNSEWSLAPQIHRVVVIWDAWKCICECRLGLGIAVGTLGICNIYSCSEYRSRCYWQTLCCIYRICKGLRGSVGIHKNSILVLFTMHSWFNDITGDINAYTHSIHFCFLMKSTYIHIVSSFQIYALWHTCFYRYKYHL